MSHIKNVQAFGKLTGICTGYGGAYKPGQQNLQVNALTTLLNNAQQVLSDVNEKQTAYDNITNTRELEFKGIRKLGSQVYSVLKSTGANALTIKDAGMSTHKLWGKRTKSKAAPAATEAKTAEVKAADAAPSTSFGYSLDYASIAFYFAKLVETVAAEKQYMPTEPELSVAGLREKLSELQGLNDGVAQAEINLTAARRKRDALSYKDDGNLFSTATATKHYVRVRLGSPAISVWKFHGYVSLNPNRDDTTSKLKPLRSDCGGFFIWCHFLLNR